MAKYVGRVRFVVLVLLVLIGSLAVGAQPASAFPSTEFRVEGIGGGDETAGDIIWYNRTAGVAGYVAAYCCINELQTTRAHFASYAGSRKIQEKTRDSNGGVVRFDRFVIGDTNLVGGINRIKITVCTLFTDTGWLCGQPVHYRKPAS
jgi:hypothetical protein